MTRDATPPRATVRSDAAGEDAGDPDVEEPRAPVVPAAETGLVANAATAEAAAIADEARHFRGSTLLALGRFIGLALDFATQVLIVRALARTDYGAFAFALSVSSLAATVGLVGLDKTISRFVPIYEQTGDQRRLAGSLVVAVSTVAFLGAAMLLAMIGLSSAAGAELVENELARRLLLILFLLAPISALDSLLLSCFAIFGSARSIALRRHVVAPLLQLGAVAIVLIADQPPEALAIGYVVAGALGVGLFAVRLLGLLRRNGILDRIRRRDMILPIGALFRFSLPLLSSDVVFLLRTSAVVILLQYLATSSEVAAYGAVLPLAKQNLLVYQSFSFLFVPAAARLFARHERERLHDLYWRTSAWIAVATFPAFALTLSLAEPLTTLLFGPRYADAGAVLGVLAVGHYVNAALGFNALTLRVQGAVRHIVAVDVLSAVVNVLASLVLIGRFGALGAALATTVTLILQNILYQAGLVRGPIGWPERRTLGVYVQLGVVAAVLLAIQSILALPFILGLVVAGAASLLVVLLNRATLRLDVYFPELRKVPVLSRILRSDVA
ncbi:MAG TPA: flippase [Candidatus Limnocylindrales bacterium]|nr:flippase [Candidatus Limnocylindrales bacterium]